MEWYELLLLFAIGAMAGFINVMAGGGSTLTLPILIFLGLDGATANGTNRVAILIQNIFAVWGFHQKNYSRFKLSLKYALFTLPGAIIGAVVAVQIGDVLFKRLLSLVIVLVVISMLLPRPRENAEGDGPAQGWLYLALFGIGFYGGFIQAGVGFLLMAALFHLARINLVQVNMHKVFIVLIYMIPALAIFAYNGHVDWLVGLVLAAGNASGGWLSARISVKRGEGLVRAVLMLALLLMAFKLLLV